MDPITNRARDDSASGAGNERTSEKLPSREPGEAKGEAGFANATCGLVSASGIREVSELRYSCLALLWDRSVVQVSYLVPSRSHFLFHLFYIVLFIYIITLRKLL